jgi:cytidylate kinase
MHPSEPTLSPKSACKCGDDGLVITIDGPAGAGKTTISKILAKRLNYRYIDTGAFYRAVAYEVSKAHISPDDDYALKLLLDSVTFNFKDSSTGPQIYSREKDISKFIRTPEISMLASAVSAREPVRKFLLDIQRNFGKGKRVVFEGRDMGTVVFPQADVKFFLVASYKARARRRFEQMVEQNDQTLVQVEQEMRKRDANDTTRNIAPLAPASDAILVDSTHLSLEQVIETMLKHIYRITSQAIPL